MLRCFQWFKDTNLKANHNHQWYRNRLWSVVSNGSKILIWKQITTDLLSWKELCCCFQWFKDTNLKANHNYIIGKGYKLCVVSNGSKILIWKQITTSARWVANSLKVVSNGSKILIWKQITTKIATLEKCYWLFPMVQRY